MTGRIFKAQQVYVYKTTQLWYLTPIDTSNTLSELCDVHMYTYV